MKCRKKPVIIEAEQWYPGENIDGILLRETEIIYSRDERYFYLSNVAKSPFKIPNAWLSVGDSEILPFAFWEVKSGRRVLARDGDQELIRKYLEYAGIEKIPEPEAYIETLEGRYEVTPGDWIITGVKGEKYPVKPDIFEMIYEPVLEKKHSEK